ncbi:MAG TPA: acyl carrier protein [Myxococcales bacterium]|jgi:acyl carrier protein|nr:acyl carrier protein [Myxococcales bacterium]
MTRAELEQKTREMMAEMFELKMEQLRPETKLFEELDLDSIDAVDLVAKVQEITGRRVDQADLRRVRTVNDIVDMVEHYLKNVA